MAVLKNTYQWLKPTNRLEELSKENNICFSHIFQICWSCPTFLYEINFTDLTFLTTKKNRLFKHTQNIYMKWCSIFDDI